MVRVSLQDPFNQLKSFSQLLVLNIKLRVLSIFIVKVPLHLLYIVSQLCVSLQQFSHCVDGVDQALSLRILLLLIVEGRSSGRHSRELLSLPTSE